MACDFLKKLPALTLVFAASVLPPTLTLSGCSEDTLVRSDCREDADCPGGLLCENLTCIDASTKSCEVVTEGNPILQPSPHAATFGDLEVQEAARTVTLHNLGNCTLTIFEAQMVAPGETTSAFACDACTQSFPIEIFPGRKKDIQLTFKAPDVGTFDADLVILSDDQEFPELRVPVHANFRGVPDLRVAPNPVDFGYVAQGRVSRKQVQVTNQGSGVAAVVVEKITLDPADSQDFALGALPEAAVTLPPVNPESRSILKLEVQYHPRSVGQHDAQLVLTTPKGEVRVSLHGNSETPPQLVVSPNSISLGQVPLGQSSHQKLTLTNEGGVPLEVKYQWGGPKPSTDLFATPAVLPSIAPGAYLEMEVAVTATTLGPINGLLVLSSNDPARPSLTLPVSAVGVAGNGPEVVKVELNYENGSEGAFDSDLRNIDLTLEHPFGYVCNKATPAPKNWGAYGNPSWLAFAPKEEPERIILADATKDGTYRVMLQYIEDCQSLPTELVAGLLGISVDVLVDLLSKGLVNIDGKDVGEIIQKTCVGRGLSNATVRVYVNGTLRAEKTVTLGRRGDSAYVVDLVRANGVFTVK